MMVQELNMLSREYLNAALIPLTLCIMIVITRSLYEAHKDFGPGWTQEPGVAAAFALWWVFLSEFIRACLAWGFLHAQIRGYVVVSGDPRITTAYMVAGIISTTATLRLIYNLSPTAWGHKAWIGAAILVVVFILLIVLGIPELIE